MTQQYSTENIENDAIDGSIKPTSKFRFLLPQVLATLPASLLMANMGAAFAYSTIINAALKGLNNNVNPHETLRMTDAEVSWLGSTAYLTKLLGGLMSGWITDPLGRKNAMILVNIPVLLSWALFYYSTSVSQIFMANCLLAYSSGFLKTPCITYSSEVCDLSVRGILISLGSASTTIMPLIIFALGTVTAWRNISLFAIILQIFTLVTLFLIPESPIWLMSRSREKKAKKSLKWLRGWRTDDRVLSEYSDMKRYKEFIDACQPCRQYQMKCTHPPPTMTQNLKQLAEKKTMKPFLIFTLCEIFAYTSGSHHLQSYFVQIMNAYQSPIDPNQATVIIGLVAVIATFVCVPLIRIFGKRNLYLICTVGVVISMSALVVYGYLYLPPNTKSYQNLKTSHVKEPSVVPLVLFCILRFFTIGTTTIILTMLGEMFPLKIRNIASGLATALVNVLTFGTIKTFYNLEYWTSLPGALCVYAALGVLGFIVAFMILPETEGFTLEDIEMHFSDDKLGLTDHVIVPQNHKFKEISKGNGDTTHERASFLPN